MFLSHRKSTHSFFTFSLLILFALVNSLAALAQQENDAARELATKVMDAMGGLEAWEKLPGIAFDFVVERDGEEIVRRSHQWNRRTSGYVVNWKEREGSECEAVFSDIYAKNGEAKVDGSPAPDSVAAKLIERGYAIFINDTYWLIMPFKLFDPGVKLAEVESENWQGKNYRVLHLSFEGVGLTPGDQYWLYVNPETYLIEGWRYVLQSGRESESLWTDYQQVGPLKLALNKPNAEGTSAIKLDNVKILAVEK